jgi:hypothetical protein
MMRNAMLIPAALSVVACATPISTVSRPDMYYEMDSDVSDSDASLFSGDAAVLSDEAINTILNYKYTPPALSRIALMPFGREVWSLWSEELSLASDEMKAGVVDRLKASPRIYDASYLPSILIPEKRTVPHLREAAARYQADLMIVYRSFCRSFERYRIFAADRSKAYCGVESVLLDTRTGLVPFTTTATRSFDVVQNQTDTNFEETRLKAQLRATSDALSDVSAEIVNFLGESK